MEVKVKEKDYSVIGVDKLAIHLNLDDDLINNEYLEAIIEASVDWIEERINGYIVPTTLEINIEEFQGNRIILEHRGFDSIDKLLIDEEEVSDYKVIKKNYSVEVIFKIPLNKAKVSLTYKAGINPKKSFIQAAYIKAGDLYDSERSDYSGNLTNNNVVLRLLNLM